MSVYIVITTIHSQVIVTLLLHLQVLNNLNDRKRMIDIILISCALLIQVSVLLMKQYIYISECIFSLYMRSLSCCHIAFTIFWLTLIFKLLQTSFWFISIIRTVLLSMYRYHPTFYLNGYCLATVSLFLALTRHSMH